MSDTQMQTDTDQPLTTTSTTQMTYNAILRPKPSVTYWRSCELHEYMLDGSIECPTYDLSNGLTSRLDTTPRRNIFALDDLRSWRGHLSDESFVRYKTTIQIDL